MKSTSRIMIGIESKGMGEMGQSIEVRVCMGWDEGMCLFRVMISSRSCKTFPAVGYSSSIDRGPCPKSSSRREEFE